MKLTCSSCHRYLDESEMDYFDDLIPLCKECNRKEIENEYY